MSQKIAFLSALRDFAQQIASRLGGEVATGSHDTAIHQLGATTASLVSWSQWPDSARRH